MMTFTTRSPTIATYRRNICLLYELSLPYGLDLNDRINIDKSATRVTATIAQASSAETKAFFNDVDAFMQDNMPSYMHAKPTSAAVMFTYISERNMQNMVVGTILAIAAIAIIMMFALQERTPRHPEPGAERFADPHDIWCLGAARGRGGLLGGDRRVNILRHHRR